LCNCSTGQPPHRQLLHARHVRDGQPRTRGDVRREGERGAGGDAVLCAALGAEGALEPEAGARVLLVPERRHRTDDVLLPLPQRDVQSVPGTILFKCHKVELATP